MTNNDILRRIRFTFNFNDIKMVAIFALADHEVSKDQVSQWLKKDDDPAYQSLNDRQMAIFLNGLISEKRGKKDGPAQAPEDKLNNNIILMKLKIALNLQADDIITLLNSVYLRVGKPELSAFFRRPGHKHFRECKDQILRNFLNAVQIKYRGEMSKPSAS